MKEISIVQISNGWVAAIKTHSGIKEEYAPDEKKLALLVKKLAEAKEDPLKEEDELKAIEEEDEEL